MATPGSVDPTRCSLPEELRAGSPALGEVHRESRLAGARGDGVQPHPHRHGDHRPDVGEGHHRDHPTQADHRPRPDSVLRATPHPAPNDGMALGNRLTGSPTKCAADGARALSVEEYRLIQGRPTRRDLAMLVVLSVRLAAIIHYYLQAFAPTNMLLRHLRTRGGLKWAVSVDTSMPSLLYFLGSLNQARNNEESGRS